MFVTRKYGGGIKRVMERVTNLINWELQTTLEDKWGCKCSYYTRKMYADTPYHSHIFICVFPELENLYQNWKKINYYVAVKHQAKVESVIEKSNFYICMFTSEKLELEKKNQIEEDSFSAKKYVFEQKYNTDEEYQQEVERKIFKIDIQAPLDAVPKLESLTLKNFRKYEGKKVIGFNDRNGQPASFVLIYAKNGMGKTSIFDGIEYALKGEVERIRKLNAKEKEKMRGPIYHHRDHSGEEAYVVINLNNGKLIRRKVANVSKDGNDCRIVPANLGSEITGRKDQRKIWDQLILPHDKIDSFISAKSPAAQFEEWTDSAAPLVNEREDFINSYNTFKSKKNELTKLEEKKHILESKLEQVMNDKLSMQKIVDLIDKYNAFPQQSRALFFDSQNAGVPEYDELINNVQIYEREIKYVVLEDLSKKIGLGESILEIGVPYCQQQLHTIGQVKDSVQEYETKLKRKKELDVLIENAKEQKLRNSVLKGKLVPLELIELTGYDKVKEGVYTYQELENREFSLTKTLESLLQEYEDILNQSQEITEQLNKLKEGLLTEEKLQKIYSNAKQYDYHKERIRYIERKLAEVKEQIEQNKKILSGKREKLEQIENLRIPDNIEDIKEQTFFEIVQFFGKSIQEDIFQLKNEYEIQIKKIGIYQNQLDKLEQNNKEVRDICEKAKKYLQLNREEKVCPLCHTKFESWEELFLSINRVNEDNTESLNKDLYLAQCGLKKIIERYDLLLQKFQKSKNNQKADLVEEISQSEKTLNSYISKQNDYMMQKNESEQKIAALHMWFAEQGVTLNNYSTKAVEEWEKLQRKTISDYEECQERLQGKKGVINDSLNATKKVLNDVTKKKEHFLEEPELFSNIMFLREKTENYDFYRELNNLREENKSCLDEIEKLNAQISTYNDVVAVTEESCVELRDSLLKKLEYLKKMKTMSELFEDFTEEGVLRDLEKWKQLMESYKKQVEYLEQIQEENSARNYFEKYKDVTKQIDDIETVFEATQKETDEAEGYFLIAKGIFEERLKDYFSQNIMNEIYQKIDPHDFMKNVDYHLSFNEKDEPQLYILVNEQIDGEAESYRPEWYFSTAQLNTVAFSSFFGRALSTKNLAFRTIFIDDPISHFDDMNVLGFSDMIRSIIESMDCQIIMSTHDRKIYNILRRKLDDQYYSSCFIDLVKNE